MKQASPDRMTQTLNGERQSSVRF